MAKLFGCPINVKAEVEDGGGSSITGEVSRSGNQPDGEAMSFSTGLHQRETNSYIRFLDSNSDSGSVSMESESDLHSCFIDFFDRESVGEFYVGSNQRLSTSVDFDILGFQEMDEEIELGLRIGSGSGSGSDDLGGLGLQVSSFKEIDSSRVEIEMSRVETDTSWVEVDMGRFEFDSDRVEDDLGRVEFDMGRVEVDLGRVEFDTGRVEVDLGLTSIEGDLFVEEVAMMADEELEWEDSEPVEANLFTPEDEEAMSLFVESMDYNQEDEGWNVDLFEDFFEESLDIMMDNDLMAFAPGVFLSSIDEYGENHGNYEEVLARTFDEAGVMGSPPASKKVVDELPEVEITSEEMNIACAICKDEILVKEKVKRLPCRHYYHGDCIVPWLGIRNTCPVCRYELPTDDVEYERNRRLQRRGSSGLGRDLMSE